MAVATSDCLRRRSARSLRRERATDSLVDAEVICLQVVRFSRFKRMVVHISLLSSGFCIGKIDLLTKAVLFCGADYDYKKAS